MDYIGNRNLFTSEFIIGCRLPINEEFEFVKTLHHWLSFKDNDREMRNFRSDNTQYIAFLHIIELKVFEEILNDLVIIYRKSYPFGEKRDFIKHTFSNTLYALENIYDWNFTYYFSPPPVIPYDICYYYDDKFKYPIIDFLLESSKDIDYYKQYYRKIVGLINNLDFDSKVEESILIPPFQTETKSETIDTKSVQNSETERTVISLAQQTNTEKETIETRLISKSGSVLTAAQINAFKIPDEDVGTVLIINGVVIPNQQKKTKAKQKTIIPKPALNPEAVQIVFDILKGYFDIAEQTELKEILETGNNAKEKLLFMKQANMLCDTFRKLYDHHFIKRCQKIELENWIVSNFFFMHNGIKKEFKSIVVNKYVSAGENGTVCKNPLINIVKGKIEKVDDPRIKKYNK